MMFKIPKKVKVGAVEYSVVQVDKVFSDNGDWCFGTIDFQELEIEINPTFPRPPQITFIHEIIHAIDMNAGDSLDERQIRMLGYGIYQLLVDNPNIFRKE